MVGIFCQRVRINHYVRRKTSVLSVRAETLILASFFTPDQKLEKSRLTHLP